MPREKDKCRKCDALCKDNSGHGNLASHVKARHSSCWQEELKQHLEGATRGAFGYMDSFVTITRSSAKVVSLKFCNSRLKQWLMDDIGCHCLSRLLQNFRKATLA